MSRGYSYLDASNRSALPAGWRTERPSLATSTRHPAGCLNRQVWVTPRELHRVPNGHRVIGTLAFLAVVIHRQEVRPMNAVSAVGAPVQSWIARLT
jgi:hypothetical protein